MTAEDNRPGQEQQREELGRLEASLEADLHQVQRAISAVQHQLAHRSERAPEDLDREEVAAQERERRGEGEQEIEAEAEIDRGMSR